MARLAEVCADPGTMGAIVQRLTDAEQPETLKEIARAWQVPYGKLCEWITEDRERAEQYSAALRFLAETLAHECIAIADEQQEATRPGGGTYDPEVTRDKLRIETRLKIASKWDRAKYGDGQSLNITVKDDRTPQTREEALLEAARNVGFMLVTAEHIKRERALLPSPAAPDVETVEPLPQEAPAAPVPDVDGAI